MTGQQLWRYNIIYCIILFTPIQAEATKALMTGQQKEPESMADYVDEANIIYCIILFTPIQAEATKALMTGQQKEPETMADYVDEAMSLSYKKRLIGCNV